MFSNFWQEFAILFLLAIVGSIAIIPYSLRLLKTSPKKKKIKLSPLLLVLLSVVQNGILFAIATSVGLILSHQTGHGAPLIKAIITGNGFNQTLIANLVTGIVLGILAGVFLFAADLLFLPYFPKKLLDTALKTTYLENFAASFYGGINEEILIRLCGLSLVVWILSKIAPSISGIDSFWIANTVMAIIFAIGHLPALKSAVGKISQALSLRTILLNTPIGLVCGIVFWHSGIEAAILTHFTADIVYHVGGTAILRSKFKQT